MVRKVLTSFKSLNLRGDIPLVLVAVSGGADSTALLHCLWEARRALGIEVMVGHVNHMIRGRESDGDASFVRLMCRRLGAKCVVKSVDVPAMALRDRVSVEMAARKARYSVLAAVARKAGAVIVTAHTIDDQAETLLLKLARGSGTRGLSGISVCGEMEGVRVLRPALDVSRREIESYLKRKGIEWREDSSNSCATYLRNRVRRRILPMMEADLNPDIRATLARTADVLAEDESLLQILADESTVACAVSRSELDLGELLQEHRAIVRRVLIAWLIANGVEQGCVDLGLVGAVERLAAGRKANASLSVTGGGHVVREYNRLCFSRSESAGIPDFEQSLTVPGRIRLTGAGVIVEAVEAKGVIRERGTPGKYPARATVSKAALGRRRLTVRSWKSGDRIRPMGMTGSRKLKDVFIDLKVPKSVRGAIPIFECGGEVIWVPGYRVARGWEVGRGEESVRLTVAPL